MLLDDDTSAFAAELHAAHERESVLAKELGKVKAENAELQTKLQKVTAALKTAKVTAREALIEMADQNAKLVQAFVDKKRECKQLKASSREDRKAWQQRLQTMELELQSNKQHIQHLMQQLHAISARQVSIPQPDLEAAVTSALQRSTQAQLRPRASPSAHTGEDCSSSDSASSSAMQADSSCMFDQGPEVSSSSQQQQHSAALREQSPLGDATNRFSSRWQHSGSSWHSSSTSPTSKPKGCVSRGRPAGEENSCPGSQLQQDQLAGQAHADAMASQQLQQQGVEAQGRQDSSRHLQDVQRQMQELLQRATVLEAENAQLKSAQAAATAQIDSLKLLQQAEQLKQQGNRHFQAQEYQQAAAAYSQALALGAGDNSLTAVLLCNRAATQHAAGQFLDAIADCCLAHQLDPKYPRALQRRAEAYMAVQHYSAAVADLTKLMEQAAVASSKEVAARLASAQAKQRTHGTLGPNHYLILGLEAGACGAEVKAAYKRLALKHHPDKATGPEAKAAAETVFVLITAANSVLSDPGKRAVYDAAYARSNSMLFGGQSHYYARSTSTSSSSQRHSSSTGMGASTYSWQHPSSTYAAGSQAAATAARAATAAAAAAAAAAASQRWQQGSGAGRGPTDSSNSANSTSSSTSGASFARGAAGVRF